MLCKNYSFYILQGYRPIYICPIHWSIDVSMEMPYATVHYTNNSFGWDNGNGVFTVWIVNSFCLILDNSSILLALITGENVIPTNKRMIPIAKHFFNLLKLIFSVHLFNQFFLDNNITRNLTTVPTQPCHCWSLKNLYEEENDL